MTCPKCGCNNVKIVDKFQNCQRCGAWWPTAGSEKPRITVTSKEKQ